MVQIGTCHKMQSLQLVLCTALTNSPWWRCDELKCEFPGHFGGHFSRHCGAAQNREECNGYTTLATF